ncbi:MAG: ComF family protein [Clostridia bacterium]|nr:ComF family protein [Clostridia bacterium]
MFEKIMDIIFPRRCGFCNVIINEEYTCKKCKKKLEYICTKDILEEVKDKYFDYFISAYFYEDVIRIKILDFKFNNKKYLYKALSEELIYKIKSFTNFVDCVMFVPVSLKRYIERGYNQSKMIAKFVAENIDKPLMQFVFVKIKNNKKQSSLKIDDRIKNVKDVYKIIRKNAVKGKNILLIDDIYTTGATVNECSKILKQNGAKQVIVATVAKSVKVNKKLRRI